MPAEHPQPDFRNMSLLHGFVLAELYRSPGRRRGLGEFAAAIDVDYQTLIQIVLRSEELGYVKSWTAKTEGRNGRPCKYFVLTDVGVSAVRWAVRRFGVRLGDLASLPVVESSGSEADVAQELGTFLGLARDRSGMSASEVAALVGHKQPWWSKHENGMVRQPNVAELLAIMRAMNTREDIVARVVELATTLNRLCAERVSDTRFSDRRQPTSSGSAERLQNQARRETR